MREVPFRGLKFDNKPPNFKPIKIP